LRSILSCRDRLKESIKTFIGDGSDTNVWSDIWLDQGRLLDLFGERVIYDSGLGRKMKVCSLNQDGAWNLPIPTSADLMDVWTWIRDISLPPLGLFSFYQVFTWTVLKRLRLVEFYTPKFRVIVVYGTHECTEILLLRMAVIGKLLTQDLLRRKGLKRSLRDVFFAGRELKTSNTCSLPYTRYVWKCNKVSFRRRLKANLLSYVKPCYLLLKVTISLPFSSAMQSLALLGRYRHNVTRTYFFVVVPKKKVDLIK